MEKTEDFRRYWIFQGRPDQYDLAEKLVPVESEVWLLSHSHQGVNPGDVVYFWRSGRQPGLYGWGFVTDPPYKDRGITQSKGQRWRVPIQYQVRFEKPISKGEITSSRQSANLAGLVILRAPQGTNFKVTTNEAIHLNRLIVERSEEAPLNPVGTDSAHFPVKSLAPLSLGRSAKTIVGAGIRYTQYNDRDQFNGEMLVSIMLNMAISSQGPSRGEPRGTMPFLEKTFSGLALQDDYLDALNHPIPAPHKAEDFYISYEVLDILESARLLAIFSTRREEIGVRHILAGLMMAGKDATLLLLESYARSAGMALADLVDSFIDYTVEAFSQDDGSVWLSQFRPGVNERLRLFEVPQSEGAASQQREVSEAPPISVSVSLPSVEATAKVAGAAVKAPAPMVPEVEPEEEAVSSALKIAFSGRPVPDRPFGADMLSIDSEVEALAHLFALQDEKRTETGDADRSTFALGLFGRWGSGKSFFIEKLKDKIDKLSNHSGDRQPRYCQEIIQIDFNAWHYNESNIWASLVHHIFDTLQKHFQRLKKEEEFKNLIRELEISQERRDQLNELIEDKHAQKNEIEASIQEREEKISRIMDQQIARFDTMPRRIATNKETRDQLLALLPKAAEILDLPTEDLRKQLEKGQKTASEIVKILNESGVLAGQGRVIGKTIIRSGLSTLFITSAGVVLLLYFALPAMLGLPDLWNEFLPIPGQYIAMITPALVWLRKRLIASANLFNDISAIEAKLLEDIRKEEEDKDSFLHSLRTEQERVSKEIVAANDKRELLDREILDLQSKLNDLGSAESLVGYINDRASSDDYRSKLGILALIRRDFDKLSMLMTTSNSFKSSRIQASNSTTKLPHIDRIILYIDDLDRVQDSRKVLQVLEAVHLLLAFPLFHVVVAVDERWAARSVLSHHGDFFGIKKVADNADNKQAEHEREFLLEQIGIQQATPREFLEKIFQISFWVRPLSKQLTLGLINGVVKRGPQALVKAVTDDKVVEKGKVEKQGLVITDNETAVIEQKGHALEQGEGEEKPVVAEMNAQPDSGAKEYSAATTALTEKVAVTESLGISLDIDFDIANEELTSMSALAPVVGRSPRTVKRFINTYRLFKAMKIPPSLSGWSDGGEEDYDILEHHVPIMILLSIQVGYPDIAVRFFDRVDRALNEGINLKLGELLEVWKSEAQKKESPEKEAERNKWLKAIDALSSVTDLYGDRPALKDLTIDAFNPWLLATSRFGFQEWIPESPIHDKSVP
jgi:predicted  nucleic acid-binding Zn-ribbon protein